jgi:hypothetical protein
VLAVVAILPDHDPGFGPFQDRELPFDGLFLLRVGGDPELRFEGKLFLCPARLYKQWRELGTKQTGGCKTMIMMWQLSVVYMTSCIDGNGLVKQIQAEVKIFGMLGNKRITYKGILDGLVEPGALAIGGSWVGLDYELAVP